MPVAPTYPGVYVQEISSGVRTITGVSTSIAAFVDYFASGPMNVATRILSFADFERLFGGLDPLSESSYAIQQFFLNGGAEAYVVRVTSLTGANAASAAAIALEDTAGGSVVLVATAKYSGTGGNAVRIDVDYATTDPATLFNLIVTQTATVSGATSVTATETFRNLVLDPTKSNDAAATVTAGSQLIALTEVSGSAGKRPAQTGTWSALVSGDLSSLSPALAATDTMDVSLGSKALGTTNPVGAALPANLTALAAQLQTLLRGLQSSGKAVLPNATVTVAGSNSSNGYLIAKPGTADPADFLALSDSGSGLATKLGFAGKQQNVQQYVLGGSQAVKAQAFPPKADGSAGAAKSGGNGTWVPTDAGVAQGIIGDAATKTGMYALLDVDQFNILCLPATMNLHDDAAAQVATTATKLCTDRRAMYLLDAPQTDGNRDTIDGIMTWLDSHATLRSKDAALYFPRIDLADPLSDFRLRKTAPSGTIAGLYARTDGARGVWKAPAGTDAALLGVQKLEYALTDPENGVLNPLAINALRSFPVYGMVCWGARTLKGADQLADEYKYVPVRRLALYIEESLFRGTKWVVFEPNAAPLWSQIRLNVGVFMQTLFRQGAFQGQTPQDAYFVHCDDTTNPQSQIDLGIVNVVVGFAPLKPAEFVIITIQQMAGQLAG